MNGGSAGKFFYEIVAADICRAHVICHVNAHVTYSYRLAAISVEKSQAALSLINMVDCNW